MKKAHILLVEDNEGDIFLTTEAFEDSQILNLMSVARNGKEAIDFLLRQGAFSEAPIPDIVLLDINLPIKSGIEVLQVIKNDENAKQIPVIMLTTSSSKKDVFDSYKNHANCYIAKPVDADNLEHVVSSIERFWLKTASLPFRKE